MVFEGVDVNLRNVTKVENTFMVATLMCIHGFMLGIPLAHYVRGGMVRAAEREGERWAAGKSVP